MTISTAERASSGHEVAHVDALSALVTWTKSYGGSVGVASALPPPVGHERSQGPDRDLDQPGTEGMHPGVGHPVVIQQDSCAPDQRQVRDQSRPVRSSPHAGQRPTAGGLLQRWGAPTPVLLSVAAVRGREGYADSAPSSSATGTPPTPSTNAPGPGRGDYSCRPQGRLNRFACLGCRTAHRKTQNWTAAMTAVMPTDSSHDQSPMKCHASAKGTAISTSRRICSHTRFFPASSTTAT